MKNKEKQELHQKTIVQLQKEIGKVEEKLAELRLELKAGKLKNFHQLMNQRHQLAFLKTILREKELTK
ncbi:50S ribosomal protein L29 [Microgenomates group bacterium RBG_19FT_COMBO_39_10]|nr:MAG: 50S ribosomal protein L29 [Microgenomates group bacterium RBG_19FT_COMBO_39_10]